MFEQWWEDGRVRKRESVTKAQLEHIAHNISRHAFPYQYLDHFFHLRHRLVLQTLQVQLLRHLVFHTLVEAVAEEIWISRSQSDFQLKFVPIERNVVPTLPLHRQWVGFLILHNSDWRLCLVKDLDELLRTWFIRSQLMIYSVLHVNLMHFVLILKSHF